MNKAIISILASVILLISCVPEVIESFDKQGIIGNVSIIGLEKLDDVTVIAESQSGVNTVYTALTDESGFFSILGIPVGPYALTALGEYTVEIPSQLVVVKPNAATSIDIQLTATGTISGTATLAGGGSHEGTFVYAEGTSYIAGTDAVGNYLIEGIPIGTYDIIFSHAGYLGDEIASVIVLGAQNTSLAGVVLSSFGRAPVINTVTANPPYVAPGETVVVKASAHDDDGDALSYSWTSIAGGFIDADVNPAIWIAPDTEGAYEIQVNVDDATYQVTGKVTVQVAETGQSPTADAGPDLLELVNVAVYFDGSGSFDPDGSIVSWDWIFGDGSTGSGETVQHTYSSLGTFTVTLTATDDDGLTGTDTAEVVIANPPQLYFDKSTYMGIADDALITVENAAENTDANQVDSLFVTVFSEDTDTVGETIFLAETGPDTGTFAGTIGFERPYTNSGYVGIVPSNEKVGVSADGSETASETVTVLYSYDNVGFTDDATYEEPPSTVTGVVYDQNSSPVAQAAVRLYNEDMDFTVESRANGAFAVYDVPQGTYWVVAAKDNYTFVTKQVTVIY